MPGTLFFSARHNLRATYSDLKPNGALSPAIALVIFFSIELDVKAESPSHFSERAHHRLV
ncbi:MAG: hypothetical protein GXP24_11430 [Planctomycetes bacterium]|nr:hypothetical protein [Planctomycetota bacterium]